MKQKKTNDPQAAEHVFLFQNFKKVGFVFGKNSNLFATLLKIEHILDRF